MYLFLKTVLDRDSAVFEDLLNKEQGKKIGTANEGCIDGSCFITMADGSVKKALDVRPGNLVRCWEERDDVHDHHKSSYNTARVMCCWQQRMANPVLMCTGFLSWSLLLN